MINPFLKAIPVIQPALEPVVLDAEPEPIEIDIKSTAVIVIDMQHAFASKGCFFDLCGVIDVSQTEKIVKPTRNLLDAARSKGIRVIYTAPDVPADLHYSGGPQSPAWYKDDNLKLMREHPEHKDKLLLRGSWGSQIVEELKPKDGDIVINKPRYGAFFGTHLDVILKTLNIKYLIFCGIATNICVMGTIRDAFYLDYFPILVSDCCAQAGPAFIQDAVIYTVKFSFGWITASTNFIKAIK
ncbi:cysteine hydrolase family protein [Chloroflexota bacterium]